MMMSGFGMGFGGIFWLIPLLIVGGFIYYVVTSAMPNNGMVQKKRDSPVFIAEERYARGEISSEELQEIRRNLRE